MLAAGLRGETDGAAPPAATTKLSSAGKVYRGLSCTQDGPGRQVRWEDRINVVPKPPPPQSAPADTALLPLHPRGEGLSQNWTTWPRGAALSTAPGLQGSWV